MPFSLSDSVEVFAPCKGGTGSGETLEKGFCTPGAEADTELVFPTLFLATTKKKVLPEAVTSEATWRSY